MWPNETGKIRFQIQSPYLTSGTIFFEIKIWSTAIPDEPVNAIQRVNIVPRSGGNLELNNIDCQFETKPGDSCRTELIVENTGDIPYDFELIVKETPDWINLEISESNFNLNSGEIKNQIYLNVSVGEGILSGESTEIFVELWVDGWNPKTISFQNDANVSPADIILNYNGEPITVGELNRLIKSHPLVFRKRKISEGKFRKELKFAIADLMRDLEINKKCYGQKLHTDVRVSTNVDMWDDAYASKRYLSHVIDENNLEKEKKYSMNNGMIDSLQNKYSNIIKINTDMFEKIEITSTDMLVTERGLPYPFIVPSFPIITSDDKLDYGSKMN